MSFKESKEFRLKRSALMSTKKASDLLLPAINEQNGDNHQSDDIDSSDGNNVRVLQINGYVGMDSLSEQFNQFVRDGFSFNIMVLGETGVGKSTLLETLFKMEFPDVTTRSNDMKTVGVTAHTYDLMERNIKLKLGLIESKGFGEYEISKVESSKCIVEYIDRQFENYLFEELKIDRNLMPVNDSRVHVCLYLISPIGHGLKAIDLVTMKEMANKTNLIPVIAKSDTITKQELDKLREKIMSEIVSNDINIYRFPTDDPDVSDLNSENNSLLPFAIVASREFVTIGDKQVRARLYPWGIVEVENKSHSDFVRLRDMILRINMEDLRENTHSRHYELYRRVRLEEIVSGKGRGIPESIKNTLNFQESKFFEEIRAKHLSEMQRKEEELKQRFLLRIQQNDTQLKQTENELIQKFNDMKSVSLNQRKALKTEKQKLEEQIKAFDAKKATFWAEYGKDWTQTLDEMIKEKINNN